MNTPLIPAEKLAQLFDALPEVVFFVKDCEGSYTHVNQTLMHRLGKHHQDEVIGLDAASLFPDPLGTRYRDQDREVVAGRLVENHLEVHLFPNRGTGWCLTCKRPLTADGRIIGIFGISRDLGHPDLRHSTYERLRRVMSYLENHYGGHVRVSKLAEVAGVSVAQLERQFRRVFQLNPGEMLTKLRIDAAMDMLRKSEWSIAAIAFACGYADQSAFTRKFHAVTGLTPGQYRVFAQ